jgi:predicted metal-dependent enzyme (double-stranded beta helix superfamily)
VALVWRPGQATPIHDHCCWCVVGVWQGVERERRYELRRGPSGLTLAVRAVAYAGPGDVSVLVPPDEDIHVVENAGAGIAISLHVYGADIAERGTSINRTFPDELVQPGRAGDAEQVSWRRLAA